MTLPPDGSTITRTYDPAGQLTDVTFSDPDTAPVHYTYDPAGQRLSMADGTGTTTYRYDAAGRRTESTDGAGNTVGYGYDTAGRLAQLTYPGGQAVIYAYDNAGQMTSATDWNGNITRFTYTPDGDPATRTYPNGVTTTYTHDPNGQPTTISTRSANGTELATYGYTYDNAGQLTGQTDGQTTENRYTFSPTGQLAGIIAVTNGSTTAGSYTTTPGGQLTALPDGTTLTYNDASQLTAAAPTEGPARTYEYDSNGSRIATTVYQTTNSSATTRYEYNGSNSLTRVSSSDGTTVDYGVDGTGLRQSRAQAGTSQRLTWATIVSGMPLLLDDGVYHYLYGPDLTPYAQINNLTDTIEYLHGDNIGSVRLMTNTAGSVAATNTYDPYGSRMSHSGISDSPIGYTGSWTDPATSLVYLRSRDYDPATGQFLAIDPIVDLTRQPYTYVDNNPLQLTDPTGLCAFWCKVAVGVGVGVVVAAVVVCAATVVCGAGALAVAGGGAVAAGGGLTIGAFETIALGGALGGLAGAAWDMAGSAEDQSGIRFSQRNGEADSTKCREAEGLLDRESAIAERTGLTRRQVKDAIHRAKRHLPRGGTRRNPDVAVDPNTGEIYVKLPNGRVSGDSIGNIFDYIPGA